MNYLIHEDKLKELNNIIGNQGSPATSKVSESFAALEVAIKTGTKEEAQKAFDAAVQANILVGKAWIQAQDWHDKVENECQYTGGTVPGESGGTQPGPPAIPGNAIEMFPEPGQNGGYALKTAEGGDVTIFGKNYSSHVLGDPTGKGPWYYYVGHMDGTWASMSCDSKQIAWGVFDQPQDPGTAWQLNTAHTQGYKAGKFCCFRIGGGGYTDETTAIFGIN